MTKNLSASGPIASSKNDGVSFTREPTRGIHKSSVDSSQQSTEHLTVNFTLLQVILEISKHNRKI